MLELGRKINGRLAGFKEEIGRSKEAAIFAWEKEQNGLFGFVATRGKDDGLPIDFKITGHLNEKVVSYVVNGEKCEIHFTDTEDAQFDYPAMQETVATKLEGRLNHKYMMLQEKEFLCKEGLFTILIGIPLGPSQPKDPFEKAWG